MKAIAIGIGSIILMLAIVAGIDQFGFALGLWDTTFWGVKQQNAQRQVFVQTQSYVQGKIQNLEQECFAYRKADGSQKSAFAGEIRNEASTIDLGKLPMDEQSCIQEARAQ